MRVSLLKVFVPQRKSFHKLWTTSYSWQKDGTKQEKNKLVLCCKEDVTLIAGEELCRVKPGTPQPRVVILGAGMAGLSAAHRLISRGISNVTILDAKERPGGRIHSCRLGDAVAEMGAGWIEGGCVANPVYNLAGSEGLLGTKIQRRRQNEGVFLTSEGRAIESVTAGIRLMNKIQHQAASLFSRLKCPPMGALQDFLKMRAEQELLELPEGERSNARKVLTGLRNEMRTRWGEDLSQMSTDMFGSYVDIPGGQVLLPLGVTGLLAPLLRDIPASQIKYCKLVQTVIWSSCAGSDCRALVKCCDGEELKADFVISTVSLGVLKSQAIQLFCPQLPPEKIDAIINLGFGHINKIYVEYKDPFWLSSEGNIHLAWSESELTERSDWVKGIGRIEQVPNTKNVLTITVGGKEAVAMEKSNDKRVAEELTNFLRSITGDPSLPCPTKMMRSKWSTDMAFLGASSFMGLNSSVAHQCALATPLPGPRDPLPPIILFAGEATCPGHFSTLQGARISGVREADRIIGLTILYNGPPPQPKLH